MRVGTIVAALALAGCEVHTGEQCANRIDDDADGLADCDDAACARHCDSDGDGAIDERLGGDDCDDADPGRFPDAPERCNTIDDDCDGLVDDEDPDIEDDAPDQRIVQHVDKDGDGAGLDRTALGCPGAPGLAPVAGDCDDRDALAAPHLAEVCDGIDNDCDIAVDALDVSLQDGLVVFRDRDGDGHGDPGRSAWGCVEPGWSADAVDCDDTRAVVYTGAPEVCDALDNDCDGAFGPDETDADGDGDPVCTDCDDADPSRSTAFDEACGPAGLDEDCDGLVDDADPSLNPYTCGLCPTTGAVPPIVMPVVAETWNPCLLDPDADALCSRDPVLEPESHTEGKRLHRVRWRTDQGYWRPELFLFLPPGPGDENTKILDWAAYAGYRTISLGYSNDATVDVACAIPQASDCYRDILYERTYGVDRSAVVDVGPADGIVARLTVLLEHLAIVHPEMGFGAYLHDGAPAWDKIVVTGWSGGGGHAGFLSKYEAVAGGILFSAPKDHDIELLSPVDWVSAPGQTPGCALFTTWHRAEPYTAPPVAILPRAWDLMGIPDRRWDIDLHPGEAIPADTTRISQSVNVREALPEGCSPHAAVGRDVCLRDELFPAYVFLACAAAAVDPATCEADEAGDATAARTGR